MGKISAGDVVLKALGLLLLTAAVLKGHELLTVPVANKDIWSWRPFLIFQVEFELAMGIWLLSGVFKRLAWLAGLLCFGLFCCVTLYKGLSGAASCGCFGRVHVNPWITLLAIDLPAVIALSLFHPKGLLASLRYSWTLVVRVVHLSWRASRGLTWRSLSRLRVILGRPLTGAISMRLAIVASVALLALGTTTPILALNQPAIATSKYEVLEPKTWIGKQLPILKYIDIGEKLKRDTWLVLFYHYDCPDCQKAIPQYERMAHDLVGNEDFLRVAFVEIPPYGPSQLRQDPTYACGHLANVKEWFVTTPVVALLTQGGKTKAAWDAESPDFEAILAEIISPERRTVENRNSGST